MLGTSCSGSSRAFLPHIVPHHMSPPHGGFLATPFPILVPSCLSMPNIKTEASLITCMRHGGSGLFVSLRHFQIPQVDVGTE